MIKNWSEKILAFIIALALVLLATLPSCKSCNKTAEQKVVAADTTSSTQLSRPINNITLPHADTSLIPVLSKVLDESFAASGQKDYAQLANYIVYRGADLKRNGEDVFNTRNNYDKNMVRITGEVFNKWNRNVLTHNYTRVFSMDQPGGQTIFVLEVLFISSKSINRKFFGFIKVKGDYKIVDVTSTL